MLNLDKHYKNKQEDNAGVKGIPKALTMRPECEIPKRTASIIELLDAEDMKVKEEYDEMEALCNECDCVNHIEDLDSDCLCPECHMDKHGFIFSSLWQHPCLCHIAHDGDDR